MEPREFATMGSKVPPPNENLPVSAAAFLPPTGLVGICTFLENLVLLMPFIPAISVASRHRTLLRRVPAVYSKSELVGRDVPLVDVKSRLCFNVSKSFGKLGN